MRMMSPEFMRVCHGGKLYDGDFASRLRGSGIYADLLAERFRLACKRLRLNDVLGALTSIDEFVTKSSTLITDTSGSRDARKKRVWAALVLLGAFETEISFILSDVQEVIRARSERAFAHLQRSVVVDQAFREKWIAAFKKGEVACEKLGTVHLLLHGIWAFKVDAAGARTDLVESDPVSLDTELS
ncbi:MAG: hypothetical protein QF511_00225 [Rhodospirillales bacterium]|nr:hypothetical protein [Rhodospirillales bacterium]HIJ44324.1 hypothetical protein [Rhodospirillaceae bacterium]